MLRLRVFGIAHASGQLEYELLLMGRIYELALGERGLLTGLWTIFFGSIASVIWVAAAVAALGSIGFMALSAVFIAALLGSSVEELAAA